MFIELWLSQREAGPGGSGCLDSKKQIVSKKQEGRLKRGLDLATGQPWPERFGSVWLGRNHIVIVVIYMRGEEAEAVDVDPPFCGGGESRAPHLSCTGASPDSAAHDPFQTT